MLEKIRRGLDRIALNDRSYKFLFKRQDTDEAVSLDCETTGFDPWVDDVVSVAAIPIKGSRILASSAYQAVIRPEAAMGAASIKGAPVAAQGRGAWAPHERRASPSCCTSSATGRSSATGSTSTSGC